MYVLLRTEQNCSIQGCQKSLRYQKNNAESWRSRARSDDSIEDDSETRPRNIELRFLKLKLLAEQLAE
jgi:hypothetical protein